MHPQIFSRAVTGRPGKTRRRQVCDVSRFMTLAAVVAAAGCAPQLQTQIVGRTSAVAAAAVVAAELPVPESQSAQVLRYVVATPRAVQLR